MADSRSTEQNPVFDYRALRLVLGFVALALPLLVSAFALPFASRLKVPPRLGFQLSQSAGPPPTTSSRAGANQ